MQTEPKDPKVKEIIKGVYIIDLKLFPKDDGYFLELARLGIKNKLQKTVNFKLQQISYSSLKPKKIKAWHLHLKQDDIWFVPPDNILLVGLYDLRKISPTKGITMRIILGGNEAKLLYIPRGVAHGCTNISSSQTTIIYFTNTHYNPNNPDEHRLKWDLLGKDFWEIKKG